MTQVKRDAIARPHTPKRSQGGPPLDARRRQQRQSGAAQRHRTGQSGNRRPPNDALYRPHHRCTATPATRCPLQLPPAGPTQPRARGAGTDSGRRRGGGLVAAPRGGREQRARVGRDGHRGRRPAPAAAAAAFASKESSGGWFGRSKPKAGKSAASPDAEAGGYAPPSVPAAPAKPLDAADSDNPFGGSSSTTSTSAPAPAVTAAPPAPASISPRPAAAVTAAAPAPAAASAPRPPAADLEDNPFAQDNPFDKDGGF